MDNGPDMRQENGVISSLMWSQGLDKRSALSLCCETETDSDLDLVASLVSRYRTSPKI